MYQLKSCCRLGRRATAGPPVTGPLCFRQPLQMFPTSGSPVEFRSSAVKMGDDFEWPARCDQTRRGGHQRLQRIPPPV